MPDQPHNNVHQGQMLMIVLPFVEFYSALVLVKAYSSQVFNFHLQTNFLNIFVFCFYSYGTNCQNIIIQPFTFYIYKSQMHLQILKFGQFNMLHNLDTNQVSKIFNHPFDQFKVNITVKFDMTDENQLYYVKTPKKAPWIYQPQKMEIQTNQKEYPLSANQERCKDIPLLCWKDPKFQFGKMQHIRINRARLFDWFVDICKVKDQSWQTLWTAIRMIDKLINQKGKIDISNIHLYGVTAFFMASKYNEDAHVLSMQVLVNEVCHKKFKKKQILKCQTEIFTWMFMHNNDKTMHFPTVEDRVFQEFPYLTDETAKLFMIEMFFLYQDPYRAFNEEIEITERDLVKQVGLTLIRGERYRNCWQVEDFYMSSYGCYNVKRYGKQLRL